MVYTNTKSDKLQKVTISFICMSVILLNVLVAGKGNAAETTASESISLSLDELIQISLINNPQLDSATEQKMQREGQ